MDLLPASSTVHVPPRLGRALLTSCITLGALGMSVTAYASPWTLPQHEVVLSTSMSFSNASEEYLNDGARQIFPLNGQFRSTSLNLGLRYGITSNLELEVQSTFKQLSYEADSVILDLVPEDLTRDQARNAIIDFDSSRMGAGDLQAALRYNVWRGVVMVTPELSLKVPLGYDKPTGTFTNIDRYLSGQDESPIVADDATLGDGQVDVQASLLLGTFFPWTRTFLRGDAGFRYRFDSPGNQFVANVKAGQFLSDRVVAFVGLRYAKTVTDGEVIGLSFVDTNPSQPAEDYVFAGNVEARDLTLDRDFTVLEAGVIFPLDKIELQLGYEQLLTGQNVSRIQSFLFGVIVNWPDATRPKDAAPTIPEDAIIEEEVIVVPVEPAPEPEPEPEPEPRVAEPPGPELEPIGPQP